MATTNAPRKPRPAKPKPKSLLDMVREAEDIVEKAMDVPEWGITVLFRGMSFASLQAIRDGGVSLEAAASGDMEQAIALLQATMADPATKELVFLGEEGASVLRKKNYAVLLRLLNEGTLVVLGVDEQETAGKG